MNYVLTENEYKQVAKILKNNISRRGTCFVSFGFNKINKPISFREMEKFAAKFCESDEYKCEPKSRMGGKDIDVRKNPAYTKRTFASKYPFLFAIANAIIAGIIAYLVGKYNDKEAEERAMVRFQDYTKQFQKWHDTVVIKTDTIYINQQDSSIKD